uniref:ubiquitinyl hydrolase 1 n=1 Tax=Ditylenchus dipsaci TaxID=166011 RepID=A0A915EDE4_9BILA
MHVDVRTLCMDYIAKNRDHFSQFLTEDFDIYLTRKREMETHGNHVELQAISEIFSRPIEIFEYSIDPINTFHPISPEANTGIENPPIRLSYHGTVHYNSVIDPFTATIGVGLGLPDFKPGMADRNLMKEASIASEAQHIEEAMLNDKLRMTDWERTEEELSKQIAKDSYMDYLRQLEGKEPTEDSIGFSVDYAKSRPNSPTSLNLTSPLSVSTTVAEEQRQLNSFSSGRFGQRSTTTNANSTRLSSSAGTLGSKRGASSPNIPCCSRDDKDRISGYSPMAKVHKNDASCSMPNIGPNFGQSFSSQAINDHMRPSTSASSLQRSYEDEPGASSESQSRLSGDAPATSSGLYEELLASSALAYDDDWGSSTTALDEAAMLARVMAVSRQSSMTP